MKRCLEQQHWRSPSVGPTTALDQAMKTAIGKALPRIVSPRRKPSTSTGGGDVNEHELRSRPSSLRAGRVKLGTHYEFIGKSARVESAVADPNVGAM